MHLMSDPQDVPLTTTRLLLEPLVVAHAQSLYPLLQDERLYSYIPYLPQEPPTSVDTLAARYRRLAARHAPDGQHIWLNWAARLRAGQPYEPYEPYVGGV